MPKQVTLTIDGREITVPEGTLIVNAAKQLGIDIPVFCYHPKMEPVGMCRMCLVEVGRPMIDRATGQPVKEADGSPKIQFGPKLETACTTPVAAGMVVKQNSDKVKAARKDVLEFILTSHPLDCPVCDKGGECSLQNLTLAYGPGKSRFQFDEKMHLQKQLPLGELIYLDRERCIQCGRCVRFEEALADDAVIGFYQRGRAIEIITSSEPGFDSHFSGNTTDICPVGALTTADFRFRARPWEMQAAPSICSHCAVGCNITFNTRREAMSGGKTVIKRVMPRQNEQVNELWICDKGRFGHHYLESEQRLKQPMLRQNGKLVPATWEEAYERIAVQAQQPGSCLFSLAGGRLTNEALFNFKQVTAHLDGHAAFYTPMAGGEWTTHFGMQPGSDLSLLAKGSVILVVACDLEEEAPLWALRVRQAVKRGAALGVIAPRKTKLERAASFSLRYAYGHERPVMETLLQEVKTAGESQAGESVESKIAALVKQAEHLVIFFGSEGLGLIGTESVAKAGADLLTETQHAGQVNSGLIGVWPAGNTQGAWELGYRPAVDLEECLTKTRLIWIAAADPAGDDPRLAQVLDPQGERRQDQLVVVQDLFLTRTAELADVVLPAQAYSSFEGSFTSGERRVQHFSAAIPAQKDCRPDFTIFAEVANRIGLTLENNHAGLIFEQLAAQIPAFTGLSYAVLNQMQLQQPEVSRTSLSYAGTVYENADGLGKTLRLNVEHKEPQPVAEDQPLQPVLEGRKLLAVPLTRLYDQGQTLLPSRLLEKRWAPTAMRVNAETLTRLGVPAGEKASVSLNGMTLQVEVVIDNDTPEGVALVPRSVGLPVLEPVVIEFL